MALKDKVRSINSQAAPCPCGCAPCEETTCNLDCVVRPRYFCGQLLTDADLTAGLTWSQNKFRLSRRREGWGAVCGLEVSCGSQPGLVSIQPGYAVDCCGDDIVVCAETTLDINARLQQPPAQCDPTAGKNRVSVGKTVKSGDLVIVDVSIAYAEQDIIPTTTLGRPACGQAGQCENSRTKEGYLLSAVEVARISTEQLAKWVDAERLITEEAAVKVKEKQTPEAATTKASGRGAAAKQAAADVGGSAGGTVANQATGDIHRVVIDATGRYQLEGLRTRSSLSGPDPMEDAFVQWVSEITACVNGVKALNLRDGMTSVEARNALSSWHSKHPSYQFCYLDGFYTVPENQLENWVIENIRHYGPAEGEIYQPLPELLFLSMQDCLHHFVAKGCAACNNQSVPIARVWLNTSVVQNKAQYTVERISTIPPFRRELGPDMLPALPGTVNLGEVIWRLPQDASMALARYGVHFELRGMQQVSLDTLQNVYDFFDPADYLLIAGISYVPVVYIDRYGMGHVVGAKRASAQVVTGSGGLRS